MVMLGRIINSDGRLWGWILWKARMYILKAVRRVAGLDAWVLAIAAGSVTESCIETLRAEVTFARPLQLQQLFAQ
jgi:hypothetical protein